MNTGPTSSSVTRHHAASDHSDRSRKSDKPRSKDDAKQFRQLMKHDGRNPALAGKNGLPSSSGHGDGSGQRDHGDGSLTAGMFALQQAQLTLHQSMVQPAPTTTASMGRPWRS